MAVEARRVLAFKAAAMALKLRCAPSKLTPACKCASAAAG